MWKFIGVAAVAGLLYGLGSHAMSTGAFSFGMLMDGILRLEPLWWLGFGISALMALGCMLTGLGRDMVRSFVAVMVFLMLGGMGQQFRSEDAAIAKFARLHRAAIEAGGPLMIDGLPLAAVPDARSIGRDALVLLGALDGERHSSVDAVKAVCAPKCSKIEIWRGSAVRLVDLDASAR